MAVQNLDPENLVDVVRGMREKKSLPPGRGRLTAPERLETEVRQCLVDGPEAVGPFGMARTHVVSEHDGMADQSRGQGVLQVSEGDATRLRLCHFDGDRSSMPRSYARR